MNDSQIQIVARLLCAGYDRCEQCDEWTEWVTCPVCDEGVCAYCVSYVDNDNCEMAHA